MAYTQSERDADLDLLGFQLAHGAKVRLVTERGLKSRLANRSAKASAGEKTALKAAYLRLVAGLPAGMLLSAEGGPNPLMPPVEPQKPAAATVPDSPAKPSPNPSANPGPEPAMIAGAGRAVATLSKEWQGELDAQQGRHARRRAPLPESASGTPMPIPARPATAMPPPQPRSLLGRVAGLLGRKEPG